MKRAMLLAGIFTLLVVLLGLPWVARGDSFSVGVRIESVNLGIFVGDPPAMVSIPGTPVYHAPSVPHNYFYYRWQYYLFHQGAWFVAANCNGPWTVIALDHVPKPILAVPVTYYKVPQGHWKKSVGPPPWAAAKGHAKNHKHGENEE